jgi:hypothetical protein
LQPRPASLNEILPAAGDNPLIVLDQLLPRILYEDSEGWRDAFAALENDWFSPLKNALGKRVDRITLIAPTIYGELHYTLTSNDRWKILEKKPRRCRPSPSASPSKAPHDPSHHPAAASRVPSGNLSNRACTPCSPASMPHAA